MAPPERVLSLRKGPPTLVLERDTWKVQSFVNPKEMQKITGGTMKQKVQIQDCEGLSLQIDDKVNSIIVDSCVDCRILLKSLIASVELVNCRKLKLQVTGVVPSISIDECQKVDIFCSYEGRNVEITTSKSTEMNLNIPESEKEGADWTEIVIPEQFHHKLDDKGKLVTTVSSLYTS